ncbi:radical SAM protein [Drancourtella sp. An210]|nr:radical SAM protein [Drancourtella sp. An210]
MTPLVTNIQKYSIHDGDGIRTSVFFKGCPLKCTWCHNPETQKYTNQLLTNELKCTGCGYCAEECPEHAIRIEGGKALTDQKACTLCGKCTDVCPQNLREMAGKTYTVKELVKELKKDEMFYEESGGGVTLSGGEVLANDMDYMEELARELYKSGISVTIDTCGYVPYSHFERILPYTETFLYDIKSMDPEKHRKYMGEDNRLILENLEKLSKDGARIYIRIPTIKEVNGTEEDMQAVIDFLLEKKIRTPQVNLLPYHNTGSSKYERLGTEYEGKNLSAPSKEEMEHFVKMFQQAGFHNTKIGG